MTTPEYRRIAPSISSRRCGASLAARRRCCAWASSGCSLRAPATSAATSSATFSLPAASLAAAASSCGSPTPQAQVDRQGQRRGVMRALPLKARRLDERSRHETKAGIRQGSGLKWHSKSNAPAAARSRSRTRSSARPADKPRRAAAMPARSAASSASSAASSAWSAPSVSGWSWQRSESGCLQLWPSACGQAAKTALSAR